MGVLRFIQAACLTYLLWLPVSQQSTLFAVLGVLAASSLAIGFTHRLRWTKPFSRVWLLLTIATALTLLVGSIRGTPGWNHQLLVWGGGLVIWSLWARSISKESIRPLLILLTTGVFAVSSLMALYALGQLGYLPAVIPDSVMTTQQAGFASNYDGSNIRFLSVSTLAAGGPLVIGGLFVGRDPLLPPRWLIGAAALAALIAAALAGRRAILLVCVTAPFVSWALQWLFRDRKRSVRIHPLLLLGGSLVLGGGLLALGTDGAGRAVAVARDAVSLYLGAGTSGTDKAIANDGVRTVQAGELLNGWAQSPLFGSGAGGVLDSGFYRSEERPWQFELQYHQLLFNGGLVGVLVVVAASLLALVAIRRVATSHPCHRGVLVMAAAAGFSLLVANASNPYLSADGHWWGVALIVGVANALNREGRVRQVARERRMGQTAVPVASCQVVPSNQTGLDRVVSEICAPLPVVTTEGRESIANPPASDLLK